jgi:hypothetical protein
VAFLDSMLFSWVEDVLARPRGSRSTRPKEHDEIRHGDRFEKVCGV